MNCLSAEKECKSGREKGRGGGVCWEDGHEDSGWGVGVTGPHKPWQVQHHKSGIFGVPHIVYVYISAGGNLCLHIPVCFLQSTGMLVFILDYPLSVTASLFAVAASPLPPSLSSPCWGGQKCDISSASACIGDKRGIDTCWLGGLVVWRRRWVGFGGLQGLEGLLCLSLAVQKADGPDRLMVLCLRHV